MKKIVLGATKVTNFVCIDPDPLGMEEDQEIQFVGGRSEDYFCPVCLEVLLEPFQFLCCGNHACGTCSGRLIATPNGLCPVCREKLNGATEDKHYKRKILNLQVRCYYHQDGCQWEGELRNLKNHVGPGDLQLCESELN